MQSTEAWVLSRASADEVRARRPGVLRLETITVSDLADDELLVEPIYGCWEANMTHAIERSPVDICAQRGEEKIVIGNAGVLRVRECGPAITDLRAGDLCSLVCVGQADSLGYPTTVFGYDDPGSIGILARRTKLLRRQVAPLPRDTRHSARQWAAFSLRYVTAWANWKKAYGCWRLQFGNGPVPPAYVWGWGGGVTLAELDLARRHGCQTAMMASDPARLATIAAHGITPIDRRQFPDLDYDSKRYHADAEYRAKYNASEQAFLQTVRELTDGDGVSIFVDYIGTAVYRATLRALSRYGVVTTAGWKTGMQLSTMRALECINWHTHVHTHGGCYQDSIDAGAYAEATGWMAEPNGQTASWENIPALAADYAEGRVSDYFPMFEVNAL